MITLRLPWPPSINHYWRQARGRFYVSAEGNEYRRNVDAVVIDELGERPALTGRVGVAIECVMPDNRVRDIDNVQKAILDSLEFAGVFLNDSQIDELRIKRLHVEPPGCVDVVVQELPSTHGG